MTETGLEQIKANVLVPIVTLDKSLMAIEDAKNAPISAISVKMLLELINV